MIPAKINTNHSAAPTLSSTRCDRRALMRG